MATEESTRTVEVNQRFSIDLEGVPGAGYMWVVTQSANALEIIDEQIVSISKPIGGNSVQRFIIEAHQTGNYSLVFELKRRWETSSVKKSVYSIQVQS